VMRGQMGFDICCLGHLMKLCPSGGLWARKKTRILIGIWRGCNGSFIRFTPPDQCGEGD
ncbi:hypothetical protein ACLOJK_004658, partial [Asimina triloba]